MKPFVARAAFLVLLLGGLLWAEVEPMPDFMDPRDSIVYKTVQIGDQRWMAENLKTDIGGSYCYDKRESNCDKRGRLYTWAGAMKLTDYYNRFSRKKLKKRAHDACPSGWHVPNNKEWQKLRYYVGKKGKKNGVGTKLKSPEVWDIDHRTPAGTDEFGFNALPGGERHYTGDYMDMNSSVQYWSSSEYDDGGAYFWRMTYDSKNIERDYDSKDFGFSVRCVSDSLYPIKEPPPPPPRIIPQVVKVQNKKIQTIHIGNQVWMAQNADQNVPGSFCYENKEENCKKFGRLYTWTAALKLAENFNNQVARDSISKRKPMGICPNGWHVPTAIDFDRLETYLKDIDEAVSVGTNLKSREGWKESEETMSGENGFGFSALASGFMDSTGAFIGVGEFSGFWSGTESDSMQAIAWKLSYMDSELSMDSVRKTEAYPIRCIMDPPDEDEIYDSTSIFDVRDSAKYKTVAIGEDTWMAENLRYAAPGSFCYENKDNRCTVYGRLYPWYVAMALPENFIENKVDSLIHEEHQGICPDGWHVPKSEEWKKLFENAQKTGEGQAAVLKSRDGWARGGKPANNASEFNALPAGAVLFGEFAELGSSTYFWVAEGGGDHGAVYWNLINATDQISTAEDFDVSAFSLRCVKNKVLQK